MKLIHLLQLIVAIKLSFGQIDLLFYLKTFLFFKKQKIHCPVSDNTQTNFLLKFRLQMRCSVGIFNAISEKHFRYSRFVKRIIAAEAQLCFQKNEFGWTIAIFNSKLHQTESKFSLNWGQSGTK